MPSRRFNGFTICLDCVRPYRLTWEMVSAGGTRKCPSCGGIIDLGEGIEGKGVGAAARTPVPPQPEALPAALGD